MLPKREGTFNALPMTMGLDETGDNSLATVQIKFAIIEEVKPGGDVDCSGEGMDIMGYFYLEKKDGEPNEQAIKSLKSSLGWDGSDLAWFNVADVSQQPVQIVLGFEEYKGKDRIKVKYMNPVGSVGGGAVSQGDPDKIKNIANRLGSKLRAISGGAPAPAPKPQAARPTAPAAPSAPVSAPTAPAASPCTADDAWAAVVTAAAAIPLDDEQTKAQWFSIIAEMFPAKQPASLTAADWGQVRALAPAKLAAPF